MSFRSFCFKASCHEIRYHPSEIISSPIISGRGVRRLYDRENRSIEERIQQERPCRTLFVRNVQYDADPESLRLQFESFGQIKNFYEMVSKRGMIFISYVRPHEKCGQEFRSLH